MQYYKKTSFLLCLLLLSRYISSCREIRVDKTKLRGWDYRLFQDTPAWELAKAVQDGRICKIKSILQEDSTLINYQEPRFGETLLMLAIWNNDYKSFITLLESNADVNIYDKYDGTSAIILTCEYNLGVKYVRKLLEYGANPNDIEVGERREGNNTRYTPLRGAAENGDLESVKLLLDVGANVNFYDEWGTCALGEALILEHFKVVLLLLEYGANFTLPIGKYANDSLMYPIEVMRRDLFPLDSEKHRDKMAVVKFIKEHYNIDYFAQPIEDYILERIKKQYPNSWEEYIEKY